MKKSYKFKTYNKNPFSKGYESSDGYRYAEIKEKINKNLDRVYSVWM